MKKIVYGVLPKIVNITKKSSFLNQNETRWLRCLKTNLVADRRYVLPAKLLGGNAIEHPVRKVECGKRRGEQHASSLVDVGHTVDVLGHPGRPRC